VCGINVESRPRFLHCSHELDCATVCCDPVLTSPRGHEDAKMSQSFVRYEKTNSVVILSFDRPEVRNAIGSHQDCQDTLEALRRAQYDPSVSFIILTGSGTAFSAGGNLKAMQSRSGIGPLATPEQTRANYRRGVQSVTEALWNCEVPIVAAVNGHALGLGLDLACLCDVRICSDNARFASSFIKLGIVPGDGGAWILPRIVGLSKASELILTGDTFDAAAALSMGLVSKITAADRLMPEALDLANRIVSNPAKALRLAKRLIREGQQQRLSDLLELSAAFQALAHETRDHAEAVDAFLEKRTPNFSGE
jgi:2-(1,2-epoxy-1,2-dihydrophenyl)acetyl-CoA isomerase